MRNAIHSRYRRGGYGRGRGCGNQQSQQHTNLNTSSRAECRDQQNQQDIVETQIISAQSDICRRSDKEHSSTRRSLSCAETQNIVSGREGYQHNRRGQHLRGIGCKKGMSAGNGFGQRLRDGSCLHNLHSLYNRYSEAATCPNPAAAESTDAAQQELPCK